MQTATTLKAQRSFIDRVEPKMEKIVDFSAAVCLTGFAGGAFYIGALFIAEGGLAGALLGVAMLAGGVMFITMAFQSLLEMFR
jgi:hypothetical protein